MSIYLYVYIIHFNSIFRLTHRKEIANQNLFVSRTTRQIDNEYLEKKKYNNTVCFSPRKTNCFQLDSVKLDSYMFSHTDILSITLDKKKKIISNVILTLTWGLTKYNRGLALSLSLSSICLRISSLLMLLRTLTSSLDSGAVAVNWMGWATSGSDFFRWRETAAAGIACTKKRNGETKRERWLLWESIDRVKALFLQMHVYRDGGEADDRPFVKKRKRKTALRI